MQEKAPRHGDPIGLVDWRKIITFEPAASSDRLGWMGLEAVRYPEAPASELNQPILTHHMLVLFSRPPEVLHLAIWGPVRAA
jgi:hypothetical protein